MNSVRLCIHRAADTIGGNCIEIVAPSGERIFLDAERPLDTPDDEPTPVPPSLDTGSPVLGVLLSHAHTDHCGLLDALPESWPVYSGEATEVQLRLSSAMRGGDVRQPCHHWENGKPLTIGPFMVTPHLIVHSAFDAYALQIEVAEKVIFYSGDFRAHGRKAVLTERLMKSPPENVDVLFMEGTNLVSGDAQPKPALNEKELEDDFARLFLETRGRVFVSWSSTNIDRTVTLYRACKRSGRVLVPDLYCMLVLERLKEFASIPQAEWGGKHMRAVVTQKMSNLLKRLGEHGFIDYLKSHRAVMKAEHLAKTPEKWVIMSRSSLVDDFAKKGVVPDENDIWVWSLWKGYLEMDSSLKMRDFFSPCQKKYIHSSGHASTEVLQKFAEALKPKKLIPVHGEAWGERQENFASVHMLTNGQWIPI